MVFTYPLKCVIIWDTESCLRNVNITGKNVAQVAKKKFTVFLAHVANLMELNMITKIQSTSVTPPNIPQPQPQTKPSFMSRYDDDEDILDEFNREDSFEDKELDELREQNKEMRKMANESGPLAVLSKGVLAAGTGAIAMVTASVGWRTTGAAISKLAKSGTVKGVEADVSKSAGTIKKYSSQAINYVKNISFIKKASNSVNTFTEKNKTLSGISIAVKDAGSKAKEATKKFFARPEVTELNKEPHSKAYEYSRKGFAGAAGVTGVAETLGVETKNQEAA